jgi:hypothetical protein
VSEGFIVELGRQYKPISRQFIQAESSLWINDGHVMGAHIRFVGESGREVMMGRVAVD